MTYPEILLDFLSMTLLENQKKLATLFADAPEVLSTEGTNTPTSEEQKKIIEDFNSQEGAEDIKKLDDLLDSL